MLGNTLPDLQRLQGDWSISSLELDGSAMGAPGGATISITGDHFRTAGMGAEYTGRLELHTGSGPKRLTMHFDSGPEAGNQNHGIYEIQGEGWRLCLSMTGGPAPAEFKTAPGSGHALETLVRATPKPAVVLDDAPRDPVPELQGEWAMVSCVRGGDPLPASFAHSGRRSIEGLVSSLYFGQQLFMQGLLSKENDEANHLKLEHTAGEAQGSTQLGIYEIKHDTLKTCFAAPGRPRPDRYGSSKTGGETYSIWKRLP